MVLGGKDNYMHAYNRNMHLYILHNYAYNQNGVWLHTTVMHMHVYIQVH